MKTTTEEPTEGQFVAVWDWGGVPWSSTYRYIGGRLHIYDEELSAWRHETLTPCESPAVYILEGSP